MTSRDFCYWLQGFFELTDATEITGDQVELIKKHLHMVFEHEIDPSFPDKETLQKIHDEEGPKIRKELEEFKNQIGQRLTQLSYGPPRIMC